MPEQKPLSKQWEELHPAMKCVGIAIVFLGMVAVFSNLSGEKDAAGPKPSAAPALRIGQDYRLSAPGGDQELWLGVSKQDADEITSALVAKDMARIYGLLKSGQALVPARPLLI